MSSASPGGVGGAWSLRGYRRGARAGIRRGDKGAILSGNDPVAFTCVFGISRAGAVWCPVNPRNEAAENRELLDLFECSVLIHQQAFSPLVEQIRCELPRVRSVLVLGGEPAGGSLSWQQFLGPEGHQGSEVVDEAAV